MAGNGFLEPLGQSAEIIEAAQRNIARLGDAAYVLGNEQLARKLYQDSDRLGLAREYLEAGRDQALRMYVEGAESASRTMVETALAVAGAKTA